MKKRRFRGVFLRLFDELLPAFGAGNGDLALALGDADGLAALGAGVIAVVAVLDAVDEQQELAVLVVTLVGIAGEAAQQRQDQQCLGEDRQHKARAGGHEHLHKAQHTAHHQHRDVQPVVTVAARHKSLDRADDIHSGLSEPIANVIHKDHLVGKILSLLYPRENRLQPFSKIVHGSFGNPSQKFLRILKIL